MSDASAELVPAGLMRNALVKNAMQSRDNFNRAAAFLHIY
jgi:hypothetical protein